MTWLKERVRKLLGLGDTRGADRVVGSSGKDASVEAGGELLPRVEFSGRSYLKKDGSAFLEVDVEPGIITGLFLEVDKQRFRPVEWEPITLKDRQRRSYLFDLYRILESVKEPELKHVVFVASNSIGESCSAPFDISGLIM